MSSPKIEFRVALHPLQSLLGDAHAHLRKVHPLSDGSVVLHLSTRAEPMGDARIRVVVAGERGLRPLDVPAEVAACVAACREDPVTRKASYGAPLSFQIGERVGLLVTDRWAWVFDPVGGAPAEAIAIEPLALGKGILASNSYVPERCGAGREGRVPVIFRHPDASPDYACYLSELEVDLHTRRGRWTSRAATGEPVTVPYRVDPDDFNGVAEYAGTTLGDAVRLEHGFHLFTMGNRTHYGRMGMPYVTVLACEAGGRNPRAVREIDESAHGLFAADGRHMLLLPFTRKGPRKGKPSLIDLEAGIETPLAARGLAGYMPMAYADGRVWMAGGGRPGSWASWDEFALRDDAGDRGELVACRLE